MKKTNKKNHLIIALIVLLLALALGYAAFSATLNINGTATSTSTWDVHFKQAGRFLKADGTTVDTTHNGTAPLSTTTTTNDTMTVSVDLAYPGDGVLLEAIVENGSSVPAKLTGFTIDNENTELEVIQADEGPAENEVLSANGGTCTATFLIRWKQSSTEQNPGTQTFTITYDYDQETTTFNGTPTHNDVATGN